MAKDQVLRLTSRGHKHDKERENYPVEAFEQYEETQIEETSDLPTHGNKTKSGRKNSRAKPTYYDLDREHDVGKGQHSKQGQQQHLQGQQQHLQGQRGALEDRTNVVYQSHPDSYQLKEEPQVGKGRYDSGMKDRFNEHHDQTTTRRPDNFEENTIDRSELRKPPSFDRSGYHDQTTTGRPAVSHEANLDLISGTHHNAANAGQGRGHQETLYHSKSLGEGRGHQTAPAHPGSSGNYDSNWGNHGENLGRGTQHMTGPDTVAGKGMLQGTQIGHGGYSYHGPGSSYGKDSNLSDEPYVHYGKGMLHGTSVPHGQRVHPDYENAPSSSMPHQHQDASQMYGDQGTGKGDRFNLGRPTETTTTKSKSLDPKFASNQTHEHSHGSLPNKSGMYHQQPNMKEDIYALGPSQIGGDSGYGVSQDGGPTNKGMQQSHNDWDGRNLHRDGLPDYDDVDDNVPGTFLHQGQESTSQALPFSKNESAHQDRYDHDTETQQYGQQQQQPQHFRGIQHHTQQQFQQQHDQSQEQKYSKENALPLPLLKENLGHGNSSGSHGYGGDSMRHDHNAGITGVQKQSQLGQDKYSGMGQQQHQDLSQTSHGKNIHNQDRQNLGQTDYGNRGWDQSDSSIQRVDQDIDNYTSNRPHELHEHQKHHGYDDRHENQGQFSSQTSGYMSKAETSSKQAHDQLSKGEEHLEGRGRQYMSGKEHEHSHGQQGHDLYGQQSYDKFGQQRHDMSGQQRDDLSGQQRHQMSSQQRHQMSSQQRHDMSSQQGHNISGQQRHDLSGQNYEDLSRQQRHELSRQQQHHDTSEYDQRQQQPEQYRPQQYQSTQNQGGSFQQGQEQRQQGQYHPSSYEGEQRHPESHSYSKKDTSFDPLEDEFGGHGREGQKLSEYSDSPRQYGGNERGEGFGRKSGEYGEFGRNISSKSAGRKMSNEYSLDKQSTTISEGAMSSGRRKSKSVYGTFKNKPTTDHFQRDIMEKERTRLRQRSIGSEDIGSYATNVGNSPSLIDPSVNTYGYKDRKKSISRGKNSPTQQAYTLAGNNQQPIRRKSSISNPGYDSQGLSPSISPEEYNTDRSYRTDDYDYEQSIPRTEQRRGSKEAKQLSKSQMQRAKLTKFTSKIMRPTL